MTRSNEEKDEMILERRKSFKKWLNSYKEAREEYEGNFLLSKLDGFSYPDTENAWWQVSYHSLHNYHEDLNKCFRIITTLVKEHYCTFNTNYHQDAFSCRVEEGWEVITNVVGRDPETFNTIVWKALVQYAKHLNELKQTNNEKLPNQV